MSNPKRTPYDRLSDYRAKRSAGATPEPFGAESVQRPRLFVVQKHAARRLHYDFRIEWNGALWSWAVPLGPSANPRVNRLAVHVEDHPVEYADFEGVIPEGNYGAGSVIVWDKGLWIPLDDPDEGLKEGKIHFELRGYKLRGIWLLLRPKGNTKDWFLKKKKDGWATDSEEPTFPEESIFSGLSVDDITDGRVRAESMAAELDGAGAARRDVAPRDLELMLASTAEGPFSSPEWLFELKYDGYRLLAHRNREGQPFLRSRNGHDLTAVFPDIARAVKALPYEELLLDGELVVLDDAARPHFQRLQARSKLSRRLDIERATVELPATFFAFDLLAFEGRDLRGLPLVERKSFLRRLLPGTGPIRFADHVMRRGEEMFAGVEAMGLEGVLAKEAQSLYRGGRSQQWLKVVVERTADLVVCGFTEPQGGRVGLGALLVGGYADGQLVFAGRVGTGFSDEQLLAFRSQLDDLLVAEPPCAQAPAGASYHWVQPICVAEVRYKEFTGEGLLRAPVFVRIRADKPPRECVIDTAANTPGDAEPAPAPEVEAAHEDRTIRFTNLDKIFWPAEKFTKGDLIDYYRDVSPWLLPYLRDRPLVLTRYPDGIEGKNFYQKNVPDFIPDWIETIAVWSESVEREIEYLVCNDLDTLLYVINLGAIPLHVWPSRVTSIQNPDWCILDLDPKGAPFADVLTLAKAIRALCEAIELPTFVKTSGSTGLHILVPLGGQCTFDQSRVLGQLIARVIEARHPDIATTARTMSARKGRVYLDYLQNRHGQLLVAPYSVRPLPGAPVSAPLEWSEVGARLGPQKYKISNLKRRLQRKKQDPLLPLLDMKPNLLRALERLAGEMGSAASGEAESA